MSHHESLQNNPEDASRGERFRRAVRQVLRKSVEAPVDTSEMMKATSDGSSDRSGYLESFRANTPRIPQNNTGSVFREAAYTGLVQASERSDLYQSTGTNTSRAIQEVDLADRIGRQADDFLLAVNSERAISNQDRADLHTMHADEQFNPHNLNYGNSTLHLELQTDGRLSEQDHQDAEALNEPNFTGVDLISRIDQAGRSGEQGPLPPQPPEL